MVELTGTRLSWRGAAYDGTLRVDGGDPEPVLALLGPEGAPDGALARAQRASSMAMTLQHAGVLRLLSVERSEGRVAWCYEAFRGLGMVHLVGSDGAAELPARAAAELVAQVAETLLALGSAGLLHPGPEPADLLLAGSGTVKIATFSGPYPASPAMRAPEGRDGGEAAAVYRLGVLLAHLTSGSPIPASSDAEAHEVAVRRALIRAMARPGPVLSDRYGQWLRGMLAWDPGERPPLSAVPAGLRGVAWATGGESLADWAGRRVQELILRVEERGVATGITPPPAPDFSDPALTEVDGPRPARDPSLPPRRPVLFDDDTSTSAEDDATQELPPAGGSPVPSSGPRSRSSAGMPVDIGPPPAALRKASLPPGFLTESSAASDKEHTEPAPESSMMSPAMLVGVIIGLLIAVVLLSAYILFGERMRSPPEPTVPDGPGLMEAVVPEHVPERTHDTGEEWPEIPPETSTADDPDAAPPERSSPRSLPSLTVDPTPTEGSSASTTDPSERSSTGRGATDPEGLVLFGGSGSHTVRFRLAPDLEGDIEVRCDGMLIAARARGEVLLKGLETGQRCKVQGYLTEDAAVRSHELIVDGPATIDCFHDRGSTCLD
ncbi:MAG: hypothetical protein EA397_10055 [Deltaproteobacteria bacterium]|nr:MAG: hypothetical protein EA397_10055 [Deltaproteobacteria bacterium]